jgi:hypothetical protein
MAPAVLLGERALHHIRVIAAAHGEALVANDDGVRLVAQDATGITLGEIMSLCGRPTAITALPSGGWAVSTTLGVTIVEEHDGVLSVGGTTALGDTDDGPAAIPSAATCHEVDEALPEALVASLRAATHIASVSPDRFLVVRAGVLFDIRTHAGRAPYVRSALSLAGSVNAMRVSADGARAYLSGKGGSHVIDLRGDVLTAAGSHDIAFWVERQDGDAVSAWLSAGKVHTARVAR